MGGGGTPADDMGVRVNSKTPLSGTYGDFTFDNSTSSKFANGGYNSRFIFVDAPPGEYIVDFGYEMMFSTTFTLKENQSVVVNDGNRNDNNEASIENIKCIYVLESFSMTIDNSDKVVTESKSSFGTTLGVNTPDFPNENQVAEMETFMGDLRFIYNVTDKEICFLASPGPDGWNEYWCTFTSNERFAVVNRRRNIRYISLVSFQGKK